MWRKILTALMMSSLVWASVLIGTECQKTVYAHEVFDCTVYVSSYGSEYTVKLYIHDAEGLFEVLEPVTTEVSVMPYSVEEVAVSAWAKDAGVDALVVDADYGSGKVGVLYPLRFVNPPVVATYPTITTEAGRSHPLEVRVSGSAVNVRVWLEPSSTSIAVSDPVDLGDLSGEEVAEFMVTPSPTALGSYKVYLYVYFVDELGEHTLRYEVDVWVNPSFLLMGIAIAALFVLVLIGYLAYRRWRGGEKSSEAQ